MSGMYGPSDRKESLATIHAAVEAGIPHHAVSGTRYPAVAMTSLDSEK